MPSFSTLRMASLHELVLVEQLVALLRHQDVVGLAYGHPARLGALAEGLAQHVVEIDHADLAAGDVEGRELRAGVRHLDLDLLVVELVGAQPLAEILARGRRRLGADQGVEHALLGVLLGLRLHLLALGLAHQADADLDQVAHDGIDVAADVADLGELGRLHLEERRAGELGQAARDLGLAAAGRADHQDVLGQHLFLEVIGQLLAPPAVAQARWPPRAWHPSGRRCSGRARRRSRGERSWSSVWIVYCSVSYCMRSVPPVRSSSLANGTEAGFLIGAHGTRDCPGRGR